MSVKAIRLIEQAIDMMTQARQEILNSSSDDQAAPEANEPDADDAEIASLDDLAAAAAKPRAKQGA